jgi:hypothetical protein
MLVAFASAAAGAVVGALTVTSMSDGAPGRAEVPSAKESAAAIGDALGPRLAALQREVAALRTDLASARRADDGTSRGTAAGDPAPNAAGPDGKAEILDAIARLGSPEQRDDPASIYSRDTDSPETPPARVDRLMALHGWDKKAAIRGKWLFLKESAALAWFGAPVDIGYRKDDAVEEWHYEVPVPFQDAADNTESIRLEFRRGRLVNVDDYTDPQ